MIVDINNIYKKKYDLILIGSGIANLAMIELFDEKKINTLILEAGDFNITQKNQDTYKSKIIGNKNYGDTSLSRLKIFGGTTNHWEGICRPLEEEDFKTWPLSYDEYIKYLPDACKFLKIKNQFDDENHNDSVKSIFWKKSEVKGEDFKNFINKSNFCDLIINSTVYDFEIDTFKNQIKQCRFILQDNKKKGGGGVYSVFGKIFILSCGTLENIRILKNLSEKKKYLFKDMPLGEYFMDHPVINVGKGIVDYDLFIKKFKFNKLKKLNNEDKNLISDVSISLDKNFIIKNNILKSEFMMQTYQSKKEYLNILKTLGAIAPKFCSEFVFCTKRPALIYINSSPEQDADIFNKVELDQSSKDHLNIKNIKILWKKSNKMRLTQVKSLEQISKFFIKNKIGRFFIKSSLFNENDYSNIPNEPGIHPLGGTRMGDSKKNSVVDKNLNFHNLKNFYINGGSVFCSSGSVNPTLSIVVFAKRLANHIIKLV